MSAAIIETTTRSVYAPKFEIEINGSKLDNEMLSAISQLKVEDKIGEGAFFTFVVNYEVEKETQEHPWLDDERFDIGNNVTIGLGYGTEMVSVMMGAITGLETELSAETAPAVTIRGQDLAYDYTKRKSPGKSYLNMSFSDIARDVAGNAGLTVEVEATDPYEGVIRKHNDESYFAFLERLAGEFGFKIRINETTVHFEPHQDEKEEVLILEYGRDIIRLSPSVNSSQLCTEVEVRGYSIHDPNTPIVGSATAGSEPRQEQDKKTASQLAQEIYGDLKIETTNVPVQSADHANSIAQEILNNASDTLLQAEVKCIGTPDLKSGMCVSIQKVGKRFSGKYFITGVTHTLDRSGFLTGLTVKRNAL